MRCPLLEALERMKAIEPDSELGHFIKKRDTFFLQCFLEVQGIQ